MVMTALQTVAVGVALVAFGLLASVLYSFRPQKKTKWEAALHGMINGYALQMPKEVAEYKSIKASNTATEKELHAALFRRALALIPITYRLQSDSFGMRRLQRSDVLRDAAFQSFERAEQLVNAEIAEVQKEASVLRPDIRWGETIYGQAAGLYQNMQAKEMQAKREAEAAAAAKARETEKRVQDEAAKKREEKQREKAIADLLKEETASSKKTK